MRKQLARHRFQSWNYLCYLVIPMLLPVCTGFAHPGTFPFSIDILQYQAQLEVDPARKYLCGMVNIRLLKKKEGMAQLSLACGDLIIDSVLLARQHLPFQRDQRGLHLELAAVAMDVRTDIAIYYHGSPSRGIRFFPEAQQVYTVFSTSQWMPCRDEAEDRARFDLTLILPKGLSSVANGRLVGKKMLPNDRVQYSWRLKDEVPTYTFGFSAGNFQLYIARDHGVKFQYLSADYPEDSLRMIFAETPAMMRFFERKAGVHYPGNCYSQVLPKGNISQEMAGFAVMRNDYGRQVLDDEANINLAAHELAHQWWGNQVTCKTWQHFWLNEGMAVFMASAYREYRFGRDAYLADIELYRQAFQKVVDKDLDKSLRFADWSNPSAEDRTLVYYKGAYFLHLLREKLGDRVFWRAIRNYTRKHFGKSVVSQDLQLALEKESGIDLGPLFREWVYGGALSGKEVKRQ